MLVWEVTDSRADEGPKLGKKNTQLVHKFDFLADAFV